jgi:DNA-binding response OmpR family regulator
MSRSVLIIDDERDLSQALAIRLRAAGYEAATADDGITGIAAASSQRPDAIVLDMRMPDLDGFEVQARLKRDPQLSRVPVIFLSANVQDTARQTALAAGAAAYLTKPYDAREVLAVIASAIDHATAGSEHERSDGHEKH